MSRKKCRRKHYPLVSNTLQIAIDAVNPIDDQRLKETRENERNALTRLTSGNPTVADWEDISRMCNLALVMSMNGIGLEVRDVCKVVEHEMRQANRRFHETGHIGLSGVGIKAIRDLMEYHDLQRTSVPFKDYQDWIVRAVAIARSGPKEDRMSWTRIKWVA